MTENRENVTPSEVFAMRKAGDHEQALRHARRLHQANMKDPWNIRVLFWCLFDEIKRLKGSENLTTETLVKEEIAALDLPEEDEKDQLMHDQRNRILGNDACSKATELSKSGKHKEAVKLIRAAAKSETRTQQVTEVYLWVLYRKLKDVQPEQRDIAIWCLNDFLACWSAAWEPNAILFKCLLIQAKRLAEDWAGMVPLIEKMGLHRLPAADFADDRSESDFAPFQDQLLSIIYKCLKRHASLHTERPIIHQLIAAWGDSFGNGEWPQYHLGRILLWTGGDPDQARDLLLKTVQRNPGDFWRWQALADALQAKEAKAALSRGVLCTCEDASFKVPLYKTYAELLADEEEFAAAKASLLEAMRLRRLSGNEWRDPIPLWFDQVTDGDEIDIHQYAIIFSSEASKLLGSALPYRLCVLIRPLKKEGRFLFLCVGSGTRTLKFDASQSPLPGVNVIEAKFEDKSDGICMVLAWQRAEIPSDLGNCEMGVVSHVNAEKRLASIKTSSQEFIPLYFDQWPNAANLAAGTFLRLLLLEESNHKTVVLKWSVVEPEAIADLVIPIQGTFTLARSQHFGFIDTNREKVFVAPSEARNLTDSSQVKGWAIRATDKHGRPSWQLLPSSI
jgi:hypothetical protein